MVGNGYGAVNRRQPLSQVLVRCIISIRSITWRGDPLSGAVRLILGQVLGLGLFFGGFWLLFLGFLRPNVALGVLGGVMIPMGMWMMARLRARKP